MTGISLSNAESLHVEEGTQDDTRELEKEKSLPDPNRPLWRRARPGMSSFELVVPRQRFVNGPVRASTIACDDRQLLCGKARRMAQNQPSASQTRTMPNKGRALAPRRAQ